MSPRTITIFLGSSEELIHDRNSFHSLIASLDDIYEPRGIRVKLKRWEDFIAHCTGSRTQDDYNKVLTACDISVCMFHRKGGKFTIEEFWKSLDSYKLIQSPKPYVYVRALVEGEVEEEVLTKFKKKLFEQMGHYWCNYATDDAMKLHFVMQFERLLNADMQSIVQESNLKVDSGSVLLYGKKIADYANLPFASENDEMKILKEKIAMLDKEVVQFRAMNLKELRPIITQKLTERNECQQRLEQLEKQLLDMAQFISKMISNGNPISERKRLAVEMFEKGNYKGVVEVLNEADIVSDYERAKAELASGRKVVETGEVMVANAEQKIRSLVEEFIMKAKTWMSTYSAPHRFESACKCYEQAIQMTRESLQMKDLAEMVREYALFLLENKQYNRAEVYCKEALSISGHLASQHPEGYNSDLAKTLNNLANLYYETQRFADAEACYQRSLAMFERLASQHPEVYESNVAMTLNNLANLYYETQRFSDAEAYYQHALSISECLALQHPEAYESDVAMILNNLATVYSKTQRFSDAEAYYQRALAIYERLASQHPEVYESNVATTLNNLANLYSDTQRFTDAEVYFQRALSICEHLASQYPKAYESNVAMILNNLASLYFHTKRFDESEDLVFRAFSIYECLEDTNLNAYEPVLIGTLNNLVELYFNKQRILTRFEETLSILERLVDISPEAYESDIALQNDCVNSYYKLKHFNRNEAEFLHAISIYERWALIYPNVYGENVVRILNSLADVYDTDAERYFQRALAICERLASQHPEGYNSDLAKILNNLANVYYNTQRFADAEAYYQRSLAMYERLASQHREMHESNVAMTLNNLANVYYNMQRFADAEAYYQRSLAMYERLASQHPETYGSDLAMTLNSLANVYYNTQFFTDAEEYCLRSLSIYERLVAANPDIYGYSYAGSLMSAAYYSLFNKKYAQSEKYSFEALKWSDDIYIYTNLAAAILLQGRYEEAKLIYLTYKDNLTDSFLEDIQTLKENNAIPSHLNKDVDNIVELLLSDLQ